MVLRLTDKTLLVTQGLKNHFGHYQIPYPSDTPVLFSEPRLVTLTDQTRQGLTLAQLSALDSETETSLIWVHAHDFEVNHGKTS